MFSVEANFIGQFKIGDNIVHNLRILEKLYLIRQEDNSVGSLLNKPVTITIISIIDALLYDFYFRVSCYTNEGVRNIRREIEEDIRSSRVEKLAVYIDKARKFNIFWQDNDFYEDIHTLRKLRNRIHIQNEANHFEADECDAFSSDQLNLAECRLELMVRILNERYSREECLHCVEDFCFPWEPHYPPG